LRLKWSAQVGSFLELTIAAVFWGFGFVATVWALGTLNPAAITLYRFLGAALLGIPFLWIFSGGWQKNLKLLITELRNSWLAGLLLCGVLLPQTIGLLTTTPSKSAFLTILYVAIVPILSAIFLKERLGVRFYFLIPLALTGIALLVNLNLQQWVVGDSWTLLCSLMASIHIFYLSVQTKKVTSLFYFSIGQNFWTGIFCLILLPFGSAFEKGSWNLFDLDPIGVWGMIALTFGSSFLAFLFQIRAQLTMSPSVASILFLLESPFSAFFSFLFLGEHLSQLQLTGGALILLCCVFIKSPTSKTAH